MCLQQRLRSNKSLWRITHCKFRYHSKPSVITNCDGDDEKEVEKIVETINDELTKLLEHWMEQERLCGFKRDETGDENDSDRSFEDEIYQETRIATTSLFSSSSNSNDNNNINNEDEGNYASINQTITKNPSQSLSFSISYSSHLPLSSSPSTVSSINTFQLTCSPQLPPKDILQRMSLPLSPDQILLRFRSDLLLHIYYNLYIKMNIVVISSDAYKLAGIFTALKQMVMIAEATKYYGLSYYTEAMVMDHEDILVKTTEFANDENGSFIVCIHSSQGVLQKYGLIALNQHELA